MSRTSSRNAVAVFYLGLSLAMACRTGEGEVASHLQAAGVTASEVRDLIGVDDGDATLAKARGHRALAGGDASR